MTTGSDMADGVTTRCLIADDQAMVREGFAAVLAAQPGMVVVGQAADGAEAVRQARHLRPDVVLMDVRMPVMDGLEAARQILGAAAGPHRTRVLSPISPASRPPARRRPPRSARSARSPAGRPRSSH